MYRISRQLRANDFDVYGHLNQSVYHVLLEEVRSAYLESLLPGPFQWVIVRVELDHLREIPVGEREVELGIEITRVGKSSLELDHKIWRTDGVLAAHGPATFVAWDPEGRQSRPWTEAERQILQSNVTAG